MCFSPSLPPLYHLRYCRNSSVFISLIYHRQDRSIRNRHIQSFILCDVQERGSGQPPLLGRRIAVLKSKRAGFIEWQEILNAGTYALVPFSFTFWHDQEKSRDYTVVIHSSYPSRLRVVRVSAIFLADCLIASILQRNDYMKEVGPHIIILA